MASSSIHNSRIQREKDTIRIMVELYCRKNHRTKNTLCPECSALLDYAFQRLDKCVFGNEKPACSKCKVHCYRKDMREKVRRVMRYSGPRMILVHPKAAIDHIIRQRQK